MEKCPKCGSIAIRTNVVRRTASMLVGSLIGTTISLGNPAHARHAAGEISNKLTPYKNYICSSCGHTWQIKSEIK